SRRARRTLARSSSRRPLLGAKVATTLALVATGVGLLTPTPASADPAPQAAAFTRETPGAFSGLVPDGVCAVDVTARGGAGGSVIGGVASSNGAGAVISARYPVTPGQTLAGEVGGGGRPSKIGRASCRGRGAGAIGPVCGAEK